MEACNLNAFKLILFVKSGHDALEIIMHELCEFHIYYEYLLIKLYVNYWGIFVKEVLDCFATRGSCGLLYNNPISLRG